MPALYVISRMWRTWNCASRASRSSGLSAQGTLYAWPSNSGNNLYHPVTPPPGRMSSWWGIMLGVNIQRSAVWTADLWMSINVRSGTILGVSHCGEVGNSRGIQTCGSSKSCQKLYCTCVFLWNCEMSCFHLYDKVVWKVWFFASKKQSERA